MIVKQPEKETMDKVIKALKTLKVASSANIIKEATGTNYASVIAVLDILVKNGSVRAVSTSNGVFYSLINKRCGEASQ